MSQLSTIIAGRKQDFTNAVIIATAILAEALVKYPVTWGKATSEQAKNAEALLNSGTFEGDATTFVNLIEAMTGEKIQHRHPVNVAFQVGQVVVPVAPLYGERTHDGYEVGKAYICVRETGGGRFRNAEMLDGKLSNGKQNTVGYMSTLSDEFRVATEEETVALVDAIFELQPIKFINDLMDNDPGLSRYAKFLAK